jgi:hypothetical protein
MVGTGMVLGMALVSAACATTGFTSTWRAPDAQPFEPKGARVVALVMNANEAQRRSAETALARELTALGAVGIPMHTIAPEANPSSEAQVRAAVEKEGATAVVVMRPTGSRQEISSTSTMYAGPSYGGFWGGYYGYGWGAPYGGTEIRTDTIVSIETLVYSLRQNKLVWAGQSNTTNPANVESFVEEIVAAAVRELRREKLL